MTINPPITPPIPTGLGTQAYRVGTTSPADGPNSQKRFSLRDHDSYVSLTMEFRCNLRCTHCMIEDTMDRLLPTDDASFDEVLAEQAATSKWQGLVLTGSEITLRKDLPDLARRARTAGFIHIRIQTHGMHLNRAPYLESLIEAGVDEFFISVAGQDAATHDHITRVPGSWDRMMQGIALIEAHPAEVKVITNTVVTAQSYTFLAGIVAALAAMKKVVQHEFWNYFPMAEDDHKSLIVRHSDLLPPLRAAILAAHAAGRRVEVKNIPECLMGDLHGALVNAQPTLVIDPTFWAEFDRNQFYQCPHRASCASTECLGLSEAYIRRYGTEAESLHPLQF
jgi:MoaA/NifB/PqqE/SkfB family radical SAM enzyme